MWELIKNDPILKTILVLLLGVFAFGFVFNIMFGAPQTAGMEHGMTQMSGYSFDATLAYIISLLTKILIIIIIIVVIITVVKFIRNHVINGLPIKSNSQIELLDKLKTNPLYIIGVLGFLIILIVSMSTQTSNHVANNNYSFSILSILIILVKILLFVSFIGLIAGVIMYFKETYYGKLHVSNFVEKNVCKNCNTELKSDWNACPVCGKEVQEDKGTEIVDTNNSVN